MDVVYAYTIIKDVLVSSECLSLKFLVCTNMYLYSFFFYFSTIPTCMYGKITLCVFYISNTDIYTP